MKLLLHLLIYLPYFFHFEFLQVLNPDLSLIPERTVESFHQQLILLNPELQEQVMSDRHFSSVILPK
ncbi:MAG: hypothetical protein IPL24_00765 [Bacteroidetes bacterium]|nr:hypothetical protein [Bacteroidota bacterium]